MLITKLVYNYSMAILTVAGDNVSQTAASLHALSGLIDQLRTRYNERFFNDKLGQDALVNIIKKLNLDKLVINIVTTLISKQRLGLLPQICDYLPQLVKKQNGEWEAEVKTARPLEKDEAAEIMAYLQKTFSKTFEIKNVLDESLLGGVVVSFDSFLLDASTINKLNRAQNYLSEYKTII
jgi:F-type H+-transporting ATPase subunit delta